MKKFFNLMLLIAAMTLASCSDVPAPYELNTNGTASSLFNQSFASSLGKFQSIGSNSNIEWRIDYNSACITGYSDFNGDGKKTNEAGVTYLVGPEIDLTAVTEAYVILNHALNYEKGDINADNSLLITSNYTGDPTATEWKSIVYPTTGLNAGFSFVESEMDVPAEMLGKKVRLAFRHTCTTSASSTWEVASITMKAGKANVESGGDEPSVSTEPTGDGTKDSPYNVAAAIKKCKEVGETATSEQYYVKGKVKSIDASGVAQYGNVTIDMVDEGADDVFKAFQIYSFDGKKFTDAEAAKIKEGDEVIVVGNLVNYKGNTPETTGKGAGHLVSLNGETGGGETPVTPPTEGLFSQDFSSSLGNFQSFGSNPGITWYNDYSSACCTGYKDYDGDGKKENQAGVTYLVSPEIDLTSVANAYVKVNQAINYEKGDINANNSILVSTNYSGDPTKATWKQLDYPTTGLGSSFSFVENKINLPAEYVGKKVRVAFRHTCSASSSSTWEVKSIAVLEGKADENTGGGGNTGGGSSDLSGDVVITFASMGWDNQRALTNETIEGIDFTFDGGGNQNAPKYFLAGNNVRMYPKNSMTVTAPQNIDKIIIKCDAYNNIDCVAEGKVTVTAGNISLNERIYTIENVAGKTVKVTNAHTGTGTASQLRMLAIGVTYAK